MATQQKFKNIDAYIKTFPKEVKAQLQSLRQTMRAAAPEAEEAITYHMPTFQIKGDAFILFAAWKKHIGVYGASSTAIEAAGKGLAPYVTEKGAILFPHNQPLPVALITKLVKQRVKEVKKAQAAR